MAANRAYQNAHYAIHAEARRAKVTAYQKANPELIRERNAAYRAANRDQIRERQRTRYHSLTPEEKRERNAANRAARDPEAVWAYRQQWLRSPKGRSYIRASVLARRGAKPTPEALAYVDIISGDPCAYCGGDVVEADHITAVVKGGSGEWDNFTPACRSCNAKKSAKSLLMFLASAR